MRTTSTDTGNTGHSSTSTPRLGGRLVTSLTGDGVGLTTVLGDVGVDELDDIRTNGGLQDSGDLDGSRGLLAVKTIDSDNGERSLYRGWMNGG